MNLHRLFTRCIPLIAGVALGAPKPNVILIMTDDMGIECLGAYGSETYQTPHLDRLASEGIRFIHCYSLPLCTPSRVKIMTGRYNFRNYTRFKHLDPSQRTFGHVAQSAGYATAVCGKWQLAGKQDGSFGETFGFDRHCLWYFNQANFGSRYLHPKLVIDNESVESPGEYGPDIVNRFVLDFIEENKDRPFLLYYPMILPHFPFEPTPDSEEWDPAAKKSQKNKKYYVDMVHYMDKLVGNVVSKLEEHGLSENTLILFTSDNGTMRGLHSTWRGGIPYPGGKGMLNNTGCHVPFIARWPGKIDPDQESSHLVDFSDFFATIQELTGGEGPTHYTIDGQSLTGALFNDPNYTPREYTYCYYDPKWGTPETGTFARNQTFKVYGADGRIYNLEEDYFERTPFYNPDASDKEQIDALNAVLEDMKSQGAEIEFKFHKSRDPASPKSKRKKDAA